MLAHSLVEPKGAPAGRYMLFLHGILGTRANWRGIARRFVKARPNWGAVLVDLREHGDSLGEAEPHTLVAAAVDVKALTDALSLPIGGALGHSFGGKVVLEWLRSREGISTEAWIVDSSPSASPVDRDTTATAEVLRILERISFTLPGGKELERPAWPKTANILLTSVIKGGRSSPPGSVSSWLRLVRRAR